MIDVPTDASATLEWLDRNRDCALDHYSPTYCDDADQSVEWRVSRVTGPINDREWAVIGRGSTPLEALRDAMSAGDA